MLLSLEDLWLEHIQNLHFFHQASINFSYIFWCLILGFIFWVFGATWCQKDRFWEPLGAQLGPKWRPKSTKMVTRSAPKSKCESRSGKRRPVFEKRGAFWHHLDDFGRPLADFGRHLGHSWPPRGSQNPPFWHQVAPKSQKMNPRMRHQKIYENLIEIWWKKWNFECAQATELLCTKAFWWLAHIMRKSKI